MNCKKALYKTIFICLLFVLIAGFTATIVYASDTPSDSDFTIEFQGGESANGVAPVLEPVKNDSSINLPQNTFTKENYEFIGWSDGEEIYPENETYIINNDVIFIAQWEEIEPIGEDEPGNIVLMGGAEPEGSTITSSDGSEGLYTVDGTDQDDEIYIESIEGNIIQITINSTEIYQLSNKSKIIINAGKGNDTIYFNLTEKSNNLTDITILGGSGEDLITTDLTAGNTNNLAGVNVLLKAEKVLFDIPSAEDQKLKIIINNLTIQAAPTEAAQFDTSQNIKVVFRNVDVKASGDFTVDATSYISNGEEVENPAEESTMYGIIIEEITGEVDQVVDTTVEGTSDAIETIVNVAPISVEVEIDTSVISANDVSI